MPPKKGRATTKKVDKYKYVDSVGTEVSPPPPSSSSRYAGRSSPLSAKRTPVKQPRARSASWAEEQAGPADPRGIPKLSNRPPSNPDQPCQESESSSQWQQSTLNNSLFPPTKADDDPDENEGAQPRFALNIPIPPPTHQTAHRTDSPVSEPLPRTHSPFAVALKTDSPVVPRKADSPVPLSAKSFLATDSPLASPARPSKRPPAKRPPRPSSTHLPSDPPIYHPPSPNMPSMIPGGAFVPPNQQRNLRACMVCSIVRTSSQFLSSGCPNCEEFLELTGSTENINDCTSQVFEGLITVADTSKSWVARYQRLEGYVSGVYATQVEGILPDEIISAVEAAGVNYVPRDGSEDQIVPKE